MLYYSDKGISTSHIQLKWYGKEAITTNSGKRIKVYYLINVRNSWLCMFTVRIMKSFTSSNGNLKKRWKNFTPFANALNQTSLFSVEFYLQPVPFFLEQIHVTTIRLNVFNTNLKSGHREKKSMWNLKTWLAKTCVVISCSKLQNYRVWYIYRIVMTVI